jgi:hypothetical protein
MVVKSSNEAMDQTISMTLMTTTTFLVISPAAVLVVAWEGVVDAMTMMQVRMMMMTMTMMQVRMIQVRMMTMLIDGIADWMMMMTMMALIDGIADRMMMMTMMTTAMMMLTH